MSFPIEASLDLSASLKKAESYQQYQVPRSDGTSLLMPKRAQIVETLKQARPLAELQDEPEFCGVPLSAARGAAQRELLERARRYTGSYDLANFAAGSESAEGAETPPLLISGHQPEIFHSGVWFKNFLLNSLARDSSATAINIAIDNDLCRSTALRVPRLSSSGDLTSTQIAFDDSRSAIPWEHRQLVSRSTWDAFPEQIKRALATFNVATDEPLLLEKYWALASHFLNEDHRLGLALARARHQMEIKSGVNNLELPLSSVVNTDWFARFSLQIMVELPRFCEVYNQCREAYRLAHRIRNEAHPVPALEESDGWLEGPWWVYRSENPTRQRLWIRNLNGQLILSDRAGWQTTIDGAVDDEGAVHQWLDLQMDGVQIRPRALLTTMYLRLFMSQVFVHGIGGGKYDQVTDNIIRNFFSVDAPPMAVATATLHLPLLTGASASVDSIQQQIQQFRTRLWDLKHSPEQLDVDLGPDFRQLCLDKSALIKSIPPRGEKWQWHQDLKKVSSALAACTDNLRDETTKQIAGLEKQLRSATIAESREYAWPLFTESELIPHLKQLAES
ncbi:MAG: hypothetical protein AB8B50_18740 [Pirellulaceae bacterium]